MKDKRLKIFTWNVHGTYMNNLVKTGHNFYIPVKPGRPYNYDGKTSGYKWPKNAHEIKAKQIKDLQYDLIILQTLQQATEEQNLVLTKKQRKVPKIFIVHSPFKRDPREYFKDKEKKKMMIGIRDKILPTINAIIHVSKYGLKQWNRAFPNVKSKSKVIYHCIETPNINWKGDTKKAVTAINNLPERIECGPDIWQKVSKKAPVVLFGANSEKFRGKGLIKNDKLKTELSKYRVYFNPTTASSLPMAMLEAMSIGLPVVTTATTDIPYIVKNGINGFTSNNTDVLSNKINLLIKNKNLAQKLGSRAKGTIKKEFSTERFIKEWNNLFKELIRAKNVRNLDI